MAREARVEFPVLRDPGNVVADMALAERSNEVLLLNGLAVVVYRGAIDDRARQGADWEAPMKDYLRQALDELLDHRAVEVIERGIAPVRP